MGDLALTFPFLLAKTLRSSPRAIAEDAVKHLESLEGILRAEVAGAGLTNPAE